MSRFTRMLRDLPARLFLAEADPRVYSAVRIVFSAVALINLIVLWPQREMWLTDGGMIDQAALRPVHVTPYLTLFSMFTESLGVSLYMIFSAIALVCLMLGIAPRWAAVAVFVWHVSYATRGAIALTGWDPALRSVSFLLMLSPLPAVWSPGGKRQPPEALRAPCLNYGLTLIRVQLLVLYWQAVLDRLDSEFWMNGEFMTYYLLSHNARWPGLWVMQWEWAATLLTWGVQVFELVLPLLLFSRRWHLPAIVLGTAFHAGIYLLSHNLLLFLLAMLVFYTAFLRGEDLDRAQAWLKQRHQ
ncbi:MAG: HTTM domain-containing protein [Verrucomicrobiaceae bacterium]|nr:HTTM domain-containing protein [Verrucomicrobiaceae bacterium]